MRQLKTKDIARTNWARVLERKEIHRTYKDQVEGILYIQKVTEPLYKTYGHDTLCIVNEGYSWYQIGRRNENYWITAMYDADDKLIQIYFDITNGNTHIDDGFFEDLYLDAVLLPDGRTFVLDEDELQEAYDQDIINQNQYEMAKRVGSEIIANCLADSYGIINSINTAYYRFKEDNYEDL